MTHLNQKYFKKGEALQSTTYNQNISNWNDSSKLIGENNIRDQGLDVHSFKDEAAIKDHYFNQIKVNPSLVLFYGELPGATHRLDALELSKLSFEDNRAYVYRSSINYKIAGAGNSGGSSETTTFLQMVVQYYFRTLESGNTYYTKLPGKRIITLKQEMYAVTSQVGDITVSINLTKDRLDGVHLSHSKLEIVPDIKLLMSAYPPGLVTPSVEITAYTASLTGYEGGA